MKSNAERPARPRRLIVNADDFGFSEAVNAGIVEAHRKGILTSATLLANAPAFDNAVELAGENPGLGVGIHLNLVRGRPLSSPENGNMRPFRLRRMTPQFLAQAEQEYRAQFEKVIAAGIRPTHIDFEKHHAWQGPLYALACRLAEEYGIPAARTLAEPVWFSLCKLGFPGLRQTTMSALLRTGFTLFGGEKAAEKAPLSHPDHFLGQLHIGQMTEKIWLRLLASLPAGVSEVMTHPGRAEKLGSDTSVNELGASRLTKNRPAELSALLSPAVRSAVEAHGITLMNFTQIL